MNTENDKQSTNDNALSKITKDRKRTNLLRKYEQNALAYLVQRIPSFINSDMLTAIGFVGSIITFVSFVLAYYCSKYYFILGVIGFFINWFGDSLDGRIAYYRNTPRKWYGFSLDLTVDWLTNMLIGFGYVIYVGPDWQVLGFAFVMLYGWAMITALLRYKIVDKYTIDSNLFGPTEVRIIISAMLILEIFVPNTLIIMGGLVTIILLMVNIMDFVKLLHMADKRDKEEKAEKARLDNK